MDKWLPNALLLRDKNSLVPTWLNQVSCIHLGGLFFAVVGWILCVISTAVDEWRLWIIEDVPGISSGKIWIGIWRTCFMVDAQNDEPMKKECLEFLEQYSSLPKEIFIAQDLMSLASVVQSLAISFMSFALWNVFKNAKQKKVLFTFFTIGGILNLISGIIIFVPLSWNLHSVLTGKGIDFPVPFLLPYLPKKQDVGVAIYVGFVASGFQQLSGLLILGGKCRRSNRVHPLITVAVDPPPSASASETQSCPHCGSSVDLAKLMAEQKI
ncbi:claudin-34 [Sceloporus undulatus]|uniref:claudin-34 n=1 Tax=Sceloporus undulatus TaxID=8520 RepID=UPI001C4BD2B6|nr:claudin-34 [Sceloporus undulatus]XP_042312436.1 claudin-34 [Sceloporus undulatus]XP_042312437.1 claudin-34 [Sceloporus undulatus]